MSDVDLNDPIQARRFALDLLTVQAKQLFAASDWQSLTLCVAQYWDDEANDAVHALLVAGRTDGVPWPHTCPDWETRDDGTVHADACGYCEPSLPFSLQGWHDNGWAIRAFEPWCREGSTQNDDHEDAYLPYAIARRTPDGVRVEGVGQIVRPWLLGLTPVEPTGEVADLLLEVYADPSHDVPRQVFADWLMERGDPRGRFIAEQLAGHDARDLLAGHALEWSGPIGVVCDATRTVFRRGFPAEVRVCFPTVASTALASNDAWTTVERLTWHPDSVVALPDLPVCTGMYDVAARAVPALGRILPQLVELGLRCEQDHVARLDEATALRSLLLTGFTNQQVDIDWEQLDRLEVWSDRLHDWLHVARVGNIGTLVLDHGLRITWHAASMQAGRLVIEPSRTRWANQVRREEILRDLGRWFHPRDVAVELELQVSGGHEGLRRAFGA